MPHDTRVSDPFLPDARVRWSLLVLFGAAAVWLAWQEGLPSFSGEGPLLSLLIAAMRRAEQPALVWYGANAALLVGAYVEWRRIHHKLTDAPAPGWLVLLVVLTAVAAALMTIRDAAPGVVLLYTLLAGYAFSLGDDPLEWAAAGIVLAIPAALTLGPVVLGVAVILLALLRDRRRGAVIAVSFLAGLALWLLLVPAVVLGWSRNLTLLDTYARTAQWTREAEMLLLPFLALVPMGLELRRRRGAARVVAMVGAATILVLAYR